MKYKKINKQIVNKDENIVIAIPRGYIQEFVEANYGRRLTEVELEKLSWSVWDEGDENLLYWIGVAVDQIIKTAKNREGDKL